MEINRLTVNNFESTLTCTLKSNRITRIYVLAFQRAGECTRITFNHAQIFIREVIGSDQPSQSSSKPLSMPMERTFQTASFGVLSGIYFFLAKIGWLYPARIVRAAIRRTIASAAPS